MGDLVHYENLDQKYFISYPKAKQLIVKKRIHNSIKLVMVDKQYRKLIKPHNSLEDNL